MAWNFLWYRAGTDGGTIIEVVSPPIKATKAALIPHALALTATALATVVDSSTVATLSDRTPKARAINSTKTAKKVCS